jgi:ribose/xylose/arabinose/galactoside ABC-type transport system permease subunit
MSVENEATSATVAPVVRKSRSERLSRIRRIWPWVFLIAMVTIFTVASKVLNNVDFISYRSVQGILVYTTTILLIGLAETMVMLTAGIDMSVHYILGLAAVVAAFIMRAMFAANMPPVLTILAGFSGGILVTIIPGWVNGRLISRFKVTSFIATLGVGYAVFGVALLISEGIAIARQPTYLGAIGNGNLLYYWPGHGFSFLKLPEGATNADLGVIIPLMPNVVFITIIVTVIIWFILSKTQFGQHIYAIGGNIQAAIRAGIPVESTLTRVYILSGVMGGVAGVLWASRFSSGDANAGFTSLLFAIAAVVIGGTSMFGGEGTVIGTVVGALIIATIQYGLVVLGMQAFWQYVAVGVVVVIAVIVDQFGRNLDR